MLLVLCAWSRAAVWSPRADEALRNILASPGSGTLVARERMAAMNGVVCCNAFSCLIVGKWHGISRVTWGSMCFGLGGYRLGSAASSFPSREVSRVRKRGWQRAATMHALGTSLGTKGTSRLSGSRSLQVMQQMRMHASTSARSASFGTGEISSIFELCAKVDQLRGPDSEIFHRLFSCTAGVASCSVGAELSQKYGMDMENR
jgi:hypothetical protein